MTQMRCDDGYKTREAQERRVLLLLGQHPDGLLGVEIGKLLGRKNKAVRKYLRASMESGLIKCTIPAGNRVTRFTLAKNIERAQAKADAIRDEWKAAARAKCNARKRVRKDKPILLARDDAPMVRRVVPASSVRLTKPPGVRWVFEVAHGQ